jgi:hypothetical protein
VDRLPRQTRGKQWGRRAVAAPLIPLESAEERRMVPGRAREVGWHSEIRAIWLVNWLLEPADNR